MKRLLFLLLLLSAPIVLQAQGYTAPDVVISNEKANIGGKVYYIHKVLPKQTLFSICKAYGVKNEDLLAANPDLKNGQTVLLTWDTLGKVKKENVSARILTAKRINAYNDFGKQPEVTPVEFKDFKVTDKGIEIKAPAMSIIAIAIK